MANVEEEDSGGITEKQHLLSGEDVGDTLAAVQGLLKKHDAFETDFKPQGAPRPRRRGDARVATARSSATSSTASSSGRTKVRPHCMYVCVVCDIAA